MWATQDKSYNITLYFVPSAYSQTILSRTGWGHVGRLTRDYHSWRESLVCICGITIPDGEILGPICSSCGAKCRWSSCNPRVGLSLADMWKQDGLLVTLYVKTGCGHLWVCWTRDWHSLQQMKMDFVFILPTTKAIIILQLPCVILRVTPYEL